MVYGDFKDLHGRRVSVKVLRDKTFIKLNIGKNLKHDGYQRILGSLVYKSFNKKVISILQVNLLIVVVLKIKIC